MAIAIAIENCLLDWPAQVMAAGRSGEKAVTSRQLAGVYVDPMDLGLRRCWLTTSIYVASHRIPRKMDNCQKDHCKSAYFDYYDKI